MAAVCIRTLIIYVLLTATLRLMGKRQIGELQISELVSTLLLSELAAMPIDDPDIPLLFALIPIFVIVALELLISDVKNRTPVLKKIFEGSPSVLICKGELDQNEMRRMRISVEELLSAFRLQGVSDPSDVEYAILEQNGRLSVIVKSGKQPASAEDAKIRLPERGIAHLLVVDGKVDEKELSFCEKDRRWLSALCDLYACAEEDIFLLTVNDNGETTFIPKRKRKNR